MFIVNQLLSLVEALTVVSHFVVLNLHYSENLEGFFKDLFPLLTFDILPTDILFEYMFSLSQIEDEAMTKSFGAIGYESMFVYNNLGSLLIFQVAMVVLQMINFLLLKLTNTRLPRPLLRVRNYF